MVHSFPVLEKPGKVRIVVEGSHGSGKKRRMEVFETQPGHHQFEGTTTKVTPCPRQKVVAVRRSSVDNEGKGKTKNKKGSGSSGAPPTAASSVVHRRGSSDGNSFADGPHSSSKKAGGGGGKKSTVPKLNNNKKTKNKKEQSDSGHRLTKQKRTASKDVQKNETRLFSGCPAPTKQGGKCKKNVSKSPKSKRNQKSSSGKGHGKGDKKNNKKKTFGFWHGPRLRRMASLNAQAKVHILYEREVRSGAAAAEESGEAHHHHHTGKGTLSKTSKKASSGKSTKDAVKKRRRLSSEASVCDDIPVVAPKRMASLNAQAILAAAYSMDHHHSRKDKGAKIQAPIESVETTTTAADAPHVPAEPNEEEAEDTVTEIINAVASEGLGGRQSSPWRPELVRKENRKRKEEAAAAEERQEHAKRSRVAPLFKVPSCKAVAPETLAAVKKDIEEEKEDETKTLSVAGLYLDDPIEEKVEVKIEEEPTLRDKIEDTAEVTITGMYINPVTNTSQSFCISRVHTYKQQATTYSPASTVGSAPPPPPLHRPVAASAGLLHARHGRSPPPPPPAHFHHHHGGGAYSFAAAPAATQTACAGALGGVPLVDMATGLPRHHHYGSAFTVPHYGHPYAPHGYFQPAGPLLQPLADPCLIHKPVPFHPFPGGSAPSSHPQQPFPAEQCHARQAVAYPPPGPGPGGQQQQSVVFAGGGSGGSAAAGGAGAAGAVSAAPSPPSPPPPGACHRRCPPGGTGAGDERQSGAAPPPAPELYFGDGCQSCAAAAAVRRYAGAAPPPPPPSTSALPQFLHQQRHLQAASVNMVKLAALPTQSFKVEMLDEAFVVAPPIAAAAKTPKHGGGGGRGHMLQRNKSSPPSADVVSQRHHHHRPREARLTTTTTTMVDDGQTPTEHQWAPPPILRRLKVDLLHVQVNSGSNGLLTRSKTLELSRNKQVVQTRSCGSMVVQQQQRREGSNNHERNGASLSASVVVSARPFLPRSSSSSKGGTKKTPRYSNGWTWDGASFKKAVYLHNDEAPVMRLCYPAMRHIQGDVIRVRDCILLKSGPRRMDLPFVAKVAALWENPDDGEMMVSVLWYYRPEHTEQGRKPHHMEDEIFASKHRDVNSVACIEDKCHVLTFNEYCRYQCRIRMLEEGLRPSPSMVADLDEAYPRKERQPSGRLSSDLVFFCRRVYDFRQKRILKNPS